MILDKVNVCKAKNEAAEERFHRQMKRFRRTKK